MNKSKTISFWNRIAKYAYKDVKELNKTSRKTIEATLNHLNSDFQVLDYACGTGRLTIEMAGNSKKIHGIDISPGMIEVAQRTAKNQRIENIHFSQTSLFENEFKEAFFDVIIAYNILHLLDNKPEVIQRIHELLKPGGKFISSTACIGEKSLLSRLGLRILTKIGFLPFIDFLKTKDLDKIISDQKLEIIETKKLSELPDYFIVSKKS